MSQQTIHSATGQLHHRSHFITVIGERPLWQAVQPLNTVIECTMVKVGRNRRNAPELRSWAIQNRRLAFLGPKFCTFLSKLWSLAPELCCQVSNPKTVSATPLAQSHYLLVDYYALCFKIYLPISDIHYHNNSRSSCHSVIFCSLKFFPCKVR